MVRDPDARQAPLLLLALLVFSLGWDLWAVTADQRLGGSDTFVPQLVALEHDIAQGQVGRWLGRLDPKGPIPAILALPLLIFVGDGVLAARLLSLIAHGVLILQVFHIARRCSGRASAGLWGALLCATAPMIFGWSRLAFQEPVLAVLVLVGLQLMLAQDLERIRPWLLLGLTVGLGLMVKLSVVAFLGGPAIWLAVTHVRGVPPGARTRALLRIGLALSTAALVALPWVVHNLGFILVNFTASHHQELGLLDRPARYLALPAVAPLLVIAVTSLVVLWRHQRDRRRSLALCGAGLLVPAALFFFVFDVWSRYIVPALAVACVVAGWGLAWAEQTLERRARRLFFGGAAALLLSQLAWVTLFGLSRTEPRQLDAGMLTPDPRPYTAMVRAIGARPGPLILVHDSMLALAGTEGREEIWRQRGFRTPLVGSNELLHTGCRRGTHLDVLLVCALLEEGVDLRGLYDKGHWAIPPGDALLEAEPIVLRWLTRQRALKVVSSATDPDGIRYVVAEVGCDPPLDGQSTP